jgi:hypothetical protein
MDAEGGKAEHNGAHTRSIVKPITDAGTDTQPDAHG